MKRKTVVTVVTALLLVFTAAAAYADPYFLFGMVFNPDGTSGTAATANSMSSFTAFRVGIDGNTTTMKAGPDTTYPEKVFPAFYNSVNTPAYAYFDAGSSDWEFASEAAGQTVVALAQVYAPQFGWSGEAYMACTQTVISAIPPSQLDFSAMTLKLIPQPTEAGSGADYISLTWTGIDMDLVAGYTVYRSDSPAGTYTAISYTAQQNRNGSVVFTDGTVAEGGCYYYKIGVNVEWGGGNGAPEYYVTDAKSAASSIVCAGSTPTITPSLENPSITETLTVTPEDTETRTYTVTATATGTDTVTETRTPTLTPTPTQTGTLTHTLSFTASVTASNTPVPTATATSALAANLEKHKSAVFNSPIENGRLQLGIYSKQAGTAFIYVYDISGGRVFREMLEVSAGVSLIDREFKKARGVYILRIVIKTQAGTEALPVKKFAVIKNIY